MYFSSNIIKAIFVYTTHFDFDVTSTFLDVNNRVRMLTFVRRHLSELTSIVAVYINYIKFLNEVGRKVIPNMSMWAKNNSAWPLLTMTRFVVIPVH